MRMLLSTDLLKLGQVTRTTLELATLSSNFHITPNYIVDPSWLRTCVCHCFCRVVGSSPKLSSVVQQHQECCGSPVVKVSNHDRHVMSSSPVPLKTRRVGQRYMLNLSRAETSSSWCGVVVRRGGASSGVVHVT
ncbi:uncharacterized protein TNCV_2764131 [Trichonephila clavipes]|nr:uncharacterized protein TNCV_2764131 [Trichonephila clavipes]